MEQRLKSVIFHLPKVIILGLALLNFVLIWLAAEMSKNIGALVDPWYKPWSYHNEPSLLLYASVFILFSSWRSNLVSVILSGYVIAKAIYLITVFGGFINWLQILSKQWEYSEGYKANFLQEWEAQIILAVVAFVLSLAYLTYNLFSINSLRHNKLN